MLAPARVAPKEGSRAGTRSPRAANLLVEGLGVGGGGRNVGVTGSLVGAGGELELVGRLQVGIAGGAVGGGVVLEVEEKGEHVDGGCRVPRVVFEGHQSENSEKTERLLNVCREKQFFAQYKRICSNVRTTLRVVPYTFSFCFWHSGWFALPWSWVPKLSAKRSGGRK